MRDKGVQKCYKKEEKLDNLDSDHAKIARKIDVDDRLFKTTKKKIVSLPSKTTRKTLEKTLQ